MQTANKPGSDRFKDSSSNPFKTQKKTAYIFLLLALFILSLSIWQLKAKVQNPFKPPLDEYGEAIVRPDILDRTIDTDGDGLSDYDEIYVYGTSPYLEDTDGDGISDYDEVMQGTDPLCPEGQDCFGGGYFYDEENLVPTSTDPVADDLSGLGELTLPSDVGVSELEQIMAGSIGIDELRQLLLQSGADPETLEQISDEDLLASYQEVLNKQNE